MMKHINIYTISIFIIFIFGLSLSDDYGISWDEMDRRESGRSVIKDISKKIGFEHNAFKYFHEQPDWEKAYGMIFELPAMIIEEILNINDKRDIFLFRHKLTFTFHFIGIICFFYFSKKLFHSNKRAMLSTLIYSLHPRIFSHSFYNPKDIIFLSLLCVSLFASIKFFHIRTIRSLILCSLFLGFAMSVRIVGLYLPFLILIFYWIEELIVNEIDLSSIWQELLLKSFILILIPFVTLIAITPVYWNNPIDSFSHIFLTAKNFSWVQNNYFFGEYIPANNLPWYYIPVWFCITTPILFLSLLIVGIFYTVYHVNKKFNEVRYIWLCLIGIAIPLIVTIIFNSTLYDGWRHLYFLYSFASIIITFGLIKLFEWEKRKLWIDNNMFLGFLLIGIFSEPIYSIIKLHPHQSVYFNFLAGKDPMINFEGDYWGTSYYQGLEWIAKNDERDSIRVCSAFGPGSANRKILKMKDRIRLFNINYNDKVTLSDNLKKINYFITGFRWHQNNLYPKAKNKIRPFNNEVFSINVNEMKILGVYKYD